MADELEHPAVRLWLGDAEQYRHYLLKRERMAALTQSEREEILSHVRPKPSLKVDMGDDMEDDDEEMEPFLPTCDTEDEESPQHYLLSTGNGLGIIDISGILTFENDDWNRYFGLVSYDDIKEAMFCAKELNCQSILLLWNSPGGSALGCDETAEFIRQFDQQVMPVYSYSSTLMTSGAYWCGSAAREVVSSRMANTGSIGVLLVSSEFSEMRKEYGITDTVFRAGRYKALGNPYEKLDDEAKQVIQKDLDEVYGYFTSAVAKFRNKTLDHVLENMADGQVFMGQRALELGLVDRLSTLNDMIVHILSSKTVDKSLKRDSIFVSNPKAFAMTTETPFTVQDLRSEASQKAYPLLVTQEEGTVSISVNPDLEQVLLDKLSAETSEVDPTPVVRSRALSDILAEHQAQITQKSTELAEVKVELMLEQAKVSELEKLVDSMKPVIAFNINRMNVAIGGSELALDKLSARDLMIQHTALEGPFKKRFPVGVTSQASENADEDELTKKIIEAQRDMALSAV